MTCTVADNFFMNFEVFENVVTQTLCLIFKKWETCTVFLSSYINVHVSGLSGERQMLWEHKLQGGVFSSFKLSQVFLYLDRNTDNMFSISFKKHGNEKKENNLLTLIIKMYILLGHAIIISTTHASSVSPLSYRNTIFSKSACIFS